MNFLTLYMRCLQATGLGSPGSFHLISPPGIQDKTFKLLQGISLLPPNKSSVGKNNQLYLLLRLIYQVPSWTSPPSCELCRFYCQVFYLIMFCCADKSCCHSLQLASNYDSHPKGCIQATSSRIQLCSKAGNNDWASIERQWNLCWFVYIACWDMPDERRCYHLMQLRDEQAFWFDAFTSSMWAFQKDKYR